VETLGGIVMRDPPQPQFSLKGRTVRSLVRLMEEWHRGLGLVSGGLQWQRSRLRPMTVETPQDDPSAPTLSWELIELTTSTQLQAEGEALQHCVASYARHCWQGGTRIWSLRRRRDATSRSVATVEVNLEKWAVVQARGFRNRLVGGRALQVLRAWAARERLRCPF
jgi:hypothetical protein